MIGESRKNKNSKLNMSWLAFNSILPYLDVHKRFFISICSPWFRNLEKLTHIYFNELGIGSSEIKIDDKYYKFGEILDIAKASEVDDPNAKRIRKNTRSKNFRGGNEWISMEDDLLEPGDIILKYSYGPRLEQQKIERMNKLRHSFMEELEKYSNSEIMINPLDVFEHSVTECKAEWPIELKRMFDRIYRSSPFNMQSIFEKHPLLKNKDRSSLLQDDLCKIYPNAFNLMKTKMEEMNRMGDVRISVLEMLAYQPVTVPHFNQFTVFENSPDYSIRIPDGFSIRKAFKRFLSIILKRRRNIRIGKFKLGGCGILSLPVGLKFDCEEIDFYLYSDDGNATKAYETLVSSVNRINFPPYSRIIQYREALNCEMVRNCKKLYIPSHARQSVGSEFQLVNNELLFIGIPVMDNDRTLVGIIRNWTSNTDRRIGSKFYIAYAEDSFIRNATTLGELREMGFRIKEDNNKSMFLLQTGNKQVELTFLKNNFSFPREFLQKNCSERYFDCHFDRYCFLEVVSSKR